MDQASPPDHMNRNISWGEWRDLMDRVKELEARLPRAELVPVTTKATRGSRLPEGWMPDPLVIMKMRDELKVSGDVLRYAHLKFVDYFMSVPGQKGVKIDWDRTWCNWMRTESERGNLTLVARPGMFATTGTVADKVQGWMELGNANTH